MIRIVYDSLTGQTSSFAHKLDDNAVSILDYNGNDKLFLCTRSFGFGEIPNTTKIFIEKYKHNIVGVAVSGNKNWGNFYGKAGDKIQEQYNIPLVLKFEVSGLPSDVKKVKNFIVKVG